MYAYTVRIEYKHFLKPQNTFKKSTEILKIFLNFEFESIN